MAKVTITMRMKLYSNLSNIRIATQESPKGKYNEVKYNVLKESSSTDSADIQFELPSTDAYVQTKNVCSANGQRCVLLLEM